MKLFVGLANGALLTYEGTEEEVGRLGVKLVRDLGPDIINVEEAEKLGGPTIRLKAPRRWTENSVRKLLGLIYGEQEKLLKFLVAHGGTATYAEIEVHMGYKGQHLSGILSPLARNAKTATKDDSTKIIDWRPSEHPGQRIYFVDPEALPLLKEELDKSSR
jgi:hypothetical protein